MKVWKMLAVLAELALLMICNRLYRIKLKQHAIIAISNAGDSFARDDGARNSEAKQARFRG